MDRDTARDWLVLAYVIAQLTEIAAALAAFAAGLWWAGVLIAGLAGWTNGRLKTALRRLGGGQ